MLQRSLRQLGPSRCGYREPLQQADFHIHSLHQPLTITASISEVSPAPDRDTTSALRQHLYGAARTTSGHLGFWDGIALGLEAVLVGRPGDGDLLSFGRGVAVAARHHGAQLLTDLLLKTLHLHLSTPEDQC